MSFSLSTGLRNSMLAAVKTALENGVIYIYSGAMPSDADQAIAGTLLGKVTLNGGSFSFGTATNGLEFDAPTSAVLSKAAAETWTYTGLADGTVGWVRFMGNATDALGALTPGSATANPRIDIAVGSSGSNVIVFANTSITTGVTGNISSLTITLPVR